MDEIKQTDLSADPFRLHLPELVLVSGSASGLGAEICRLLVSGGVHTVGVDLGKATEDLGKSASYTHVQGDVSQEAVWSEAIVVAQNRRPRSLGLVTCAAVLEVSDVIGSSKEHWFKSFSINVYGTVLGIQAALPLMIELGGGPIVAVGSIDALFAEQQLVAYCATKGAVRQIARTIALDHARNGLRVNILHPGPMRAGLFERHMSSADDPEKFLATRAARQPFGRILEAKEVAYGVIFLLSKQATAINGADLIADGGLTTGFDFRTGKEGASVKSRAGVAEPT
jgi:NAD(P)-dependent dehydrogenase (short-subunit alcohol dehydrogenase family)